MLGLGDEKESENAIHALPQMDLSLPSAPKALKDLVYEHVPDLTMHVSADTFDFFVGNRPGGPNPMAPKLLLFTDKTTVPGLFRTVAMAMRAYEMAFGVVH